MAKNGYINIVSRYIGKKCISGMLGAPDCTQSPNSGGNLANIAGMHSVMDYMQSPNNCCGLHTVTKHWWSNYMQSIAECIFK